ncbi:hypothetical protein [Paraburkholderia sp. DGU8]|uniref:hypothetical protein n=1 Tax=Paraburkholderia sp. DGU8 TaxID=3161997 RepID=UPI00346669A9
MKAVVAGVLLIAAVLAWRLIAEVANNGQLRGQVKQLNAQLADEVANNGQLRGQVKQLNAQLADKSGLESLQLQERCAEQAKKVFHALGYKEVQQNLNSDSYQSHYNTRLGKCFMAIESDNRTTIPGKEFINRVLLDAFEQREYAEYTWMSSENKKYWEVPPMNCKLMEPSTSEQICKSEDEYKAFVAKYVE